MTSNKDSAIRNSIKERYTEIARSDEREACGCAAPACCQGPEEGNVISIDALSSRMGYSQEDLAAAPEGSNLALGCGNPQAIADLKPGETVLDLGSGAGFDCFLAARQVGPGGKVIGIDMTPDMVAKARDNARSNNYDHVEFRPGEIERLPVDDESIDVIISNCVINLSTEKAQVFHEAYRVLKPGGRLAIFDVVAAAELPEEIKGDLALYGSCIAGSETIPTLEKYLVEAGFSEIQILIKGESREFIKDWAPSLRPEEYIQSAFIRARKRVDP